MITPAHASIEQPQEKMFERAQALLAAYEATGAVELSAEDKRCLQIVAARARAVSVELSTYMAALLGIGGPNDTARQLDN